MAGREVLGWKRGRCQSAVLSTPRRESVTITVRSPWHLGFPDFRKRWRFSLFTACTEHKTQFVDECGRCGAPIHGFAIGLAGLERVLTPNGEVPFVRCVACGWDLRGRGPTCGQADDQVLATQKTHEDLLSQSNRGGGDPSDYSWLLQHAVELFSKELGTLQFGFLKARHRASVLQRAAWLLQDDRWRYISSIRTTARPSLSVGARKKSPRSIEHTHDVSSTYANGS